MTLSKRLLSVMTVAGIVSLFSFSAIALEDADVPEEGITQGEFALWLVEAAGAEGKLPPAALADDAINLLQKLGVKPKEGWSADKKLTKKDLVEMLGLTEKGAEGKSWLDLIKMLVQFVVDTIEQISATSQGGVSPSVSPGG